MLRTTNGFSTYGPKGRSGDRSSIFNTTATSMMKSFEVRRTDDDVLTASVTL